MAKSTQMNYDKSLAEHSDSIIEDGKATTAWADLPTLRSPAGCQDSEAGSQDKIEVRPLPLKPP